MSFGSETGSKEPLGPNTTSFSNSWTIFPGYCRQAVHTRFCPVLLVTVPQFCAPLYGNSVVNNAPGHFCRIFLRPVCPQTVKKDCVFRRGGNNLNRFGLRLEIPCRYSRNTPVQKTPVIISEIFGNDCFCGKLTVLLDCFGKPPVEVGVEPPLISLELIRCVYMVIL